MKKRKIFLAIGLSTSLFMGSLFSVPVLAEEVSGEETVVTEQEAGEEPAVEVVEPSESASEEQTGNETENMIVSEGEVTKTESKDLNSDQCTVEFLDLKTTDGYYYTGKDIVPELNVYYTYTYSGTAEATADLFKQDGYEKDSDKSTADQLVTTDGHKFSVETKTENDKTTTSYKVLLIKDIDYSLAFTNNKNLGNAEVKVKAIEKTATKYKGEKSEKFTIKEIEHWWSSWTVSKKATVFSKGEKIRSCSICGKKEVSSIAKLTPTIKLNYSSLTLKKKQSTTVLKATSLASGDYVKSYSSSKKKVAKVDQYGKITGVKKGTAYIYVKLASGKTGRVKVKVQNGTVKTSKVSVNTSSLTMRKGTNYTLNTSRSPITSQQKITYSSSKKSVAKVNSKGVITAVKPGTAKVYVKSGSKKKTVTVKVLDAIVNQNPTVTVNKTIGTPNVFLDKANQISNIIVSDRNWQYSNSGLSIYFEAARKNPRRVTSCANYVCFCMQKFGTFKEGMRFYSDGNGKLRFEGNKYYSAKEIEKTLYTYYDIIPVSGQNVNTAGLQAGDIVCWTGHTNIYAGKRGSSHYWYDAGRGSISDKTKESGTFTNMYRASTFSSLKMTYIIRLKPQYYNYTLQ